MSDSSVFVVIDMQRQFTSSDGPFRVERADELVENVQSAVNVARRNDVPVIWVSQRVRSAVGPGMTSRRFDQPNIHQGDMAALDDRLDVGRDIVVNKHRQSAFFGTDLESILRSLGADSIIISGVTTNVCVLATAIDGAARDFGIIVAKDLTASLPVRRDGREIMSAHEVQAAAEAFVIHALGEVARTEELEAIRS